MKNTSDFDFERTKDTLELAVQLLSEQIQHFQDLRSITLDSFTHATLTGRLGGLSYSLGVLNGVLEVAKGNK